jgi:pimeloyl-ACP methyl ester carboxylesterase
MLPMAGRSLRRVLLGAVTLITLLATTAVPAVAAPTGLPAWGGGGGAAGSGPALQVPAADLARSLTCHDVPGSPLPTILLIPGTTLTPQANFSWNYERAFTAHNRPWCAVTLPNNAMSDIQVSAEYVVAAIRGIAGRSGKPVSIVGFSQGGMIGRWALKWWPDTRHDVGKVIGLDPSNHGTLDAYPVCVPGCAPSLWQQQTGSKFLAALNAGGETFAGIAYTSIFTPIDEVVVPNLPPAPSSALNTGAGARRNISTFDVCLGHVAEHLTMGSFDAVGYALVIDALDHHDPADPASVDKAVCLQPFNEGVNPVTFPVDLAQYTATVATVLATYPHVFAEPPLAPYATGT